MAPFKVLSWASYFHYKNMFLARKITREYIVVSEKWQM
jgi:hypothetical protein